MDATCKNCPFWDAAPDDRAGRSEQKCRVRPPAAVTVTSRATAQNRDATWPWTECDDWCGEHPLRQRDRLAAMAMQGLLAFVADPTIPDVPPTRLAANAYRIADTMLAARGETP